MKSEEGFVKREYGESLAQSEMDRSLREKEKSLIIQIDNSTRELIEGLRSIESLAENTNKRLLNPLEKIIPKEEKKEPMPRGWLETHLADLRVATDKAIKIIDKLNRLNFATKTEVK